MTKKPKRMDAWSSRCNRRALQRRHRSCCTVTYSRVISQSDYVCPLCCEELDISDREFYPCKCGYQVCMWCWHRIRESESGLCPACRTPYGEDPHQFSAVDVEDVLKANKEKEEKAKRERQKLSEDESTAMEVPKDRTQLANMRVIRRNLVYAVGLPPSIASEEILRKPEYFGQYGKISKIVLNRSPMTASGDVRRASASAYVTFAHKEDTLACILALDGFYMDGRNIRASYGTSKYCSAFIKGHVRCNNPECTYLHEMGAEEDTFTKQEIQAGYVTSGRDVLARQQQIVAEQLRIGAGGGGGGVLRKRTGGGGPSGTGKAATNPVFPVPEYDEPAKPSPPMVPPPAGVARASTTSATLHPATISAKLGRASSIAVTKDIPTPTPISTTTRSKSVSAGSTSPRPATAASVVAGGRSLKSDAADSTTTLTPLTPLKRVTKATQRSASVGANAEEAKSLRNGKKNGVRSTMSGAPIMPSAQAAGSSLIGGDVIGPPTLKPRAVQGLAGLGGDPVPLSSLGGEPIDLHEASPPIGGLTSALGGEIFTGQLPSGSKSTIGGGGDKWNSTPLGGVSLSTGPMLGGGANPNDVMWNGASGHGLGAPGPAPIGGGVIRGSRAPGPPPAAPGSSTSALASILGINLPTGSGSLHETSSLWGAPAPVPSGPSPLSALNSGALPITDYHSSGGSSLIGGVPIGGAPMGGPGAFGGGNSKNDIALLQSLLPGVHITSGNESMGYGGNAGWNGGSSPGHSRPMGMGMGSGNLNGDVIGGNWNGGVPASPGSIGAIGQGAMQQNQRRGPGIW